MKFSVLAIILAVAPHRLATAEDDGDCRLWMGPSSLSSGSIRYGLYAGVDFKVDDVLPDVELGIPYTDFFIEPNKNTPYTKGILEYLENQMWTSDFASSKFEGNISTSPYFPGIGALGNYHSLISNADWLLAASLLREREDITEPGRPHLSRGAITNLYNVTMKATQPIPAGMEIFPDFGDMWDKDDSTPYQDKFSRKDFVEADKVVDRIVDFYDRFQDEMSEDLKEDMLDFMLDKVLATAGGMRATTIKALIPQNYRKLKSVQEAGGTYLYRNRNLLKKPKWFEKNAICVDNIYSAKSTVPEAGRGAFASRDVVKGEVISIVPTILFGKKDLMKMYDIVSVPDEEDKSKNKIAYDKFKPLGQQLGLNYAFGHPESTFLFLPTAPAVHLINHKSSPNAKLQWSNHKVMYNDQATWDHTVEEVQNFKSNMIVLEIEASEDIKKGDEIFIDYGPEWVEAWEKYESMWEAKYKDKEWPLKAEDVRLTFKDKPYPVAREEGTDVIPAGVEIACYVKTTTVPDGTVAQTEDGQDIWMWDGPREYSDYSGSLLTMCDLLDRHDDGFGSFNYTVTTKTRSNGQIFVSQVKEVPHVAVTVIDSPYTSDIHMKDAFRHYIGLPDEIFPQNWRDLR
eukprot:CAMPEP_0172439204 /NCGR_PEP_ID=MMETSP1065-20121228/265_1 /TAXON_ID=265537 /ORGANISM="Amphiprora paludosa, Strain CCMP125" /LENGTH=625 /DNA_ID=CAMNT_0013187853 /DNA_START=20 /DNA_END=1897 /DNA_ORIENTATION=-